MPEYESPTITELGTVQDMTLNVYKSTGSGDLIFVGGQQVADAGPTTNS